ncbi:hypothetical protein ACJRO7_005258 [Eucalyptus globulus]|uniref:TFA2 Winged helix domain-containing protein n=1 Tax=Eucalyptus globulus TaxID=34317 RepID=A0ABD3IZ60_EUCGL
MGFGASPISLVGRPRVGNNSRSLLNYILQGPWALAHGLWLSREKNRTIDKLGLRFGPQKTCVLFLQKPATDDPVPAVSTNSGHRSFDTSFCPRAAVDFRSIPAIWSSGDFCKLVDMLSNKVVFGNLANNPKVYYDGQRFSYESKHEVKDNNKLLKLIRSYTEGIKVIDPKDAYPTVMEDLGPFTGLKAAGQVWLLSNFDSQEDIAYPNDPKQLFRSIELPRDMIDIENDLQKNRMKPSTNTTQRRLAAQIHGTSQKPKLKKKKHEISKRTKLTNVHLPELFENLRGS